MLPINSNIDRTVLLSKAGNKTKRFPSQSVFPIEPFQPVTCMICIRSVQEIEYQLLHQFCSNCLNKTICPLCIEQITSLPCPFCHTNNKIWRKTKRDILFNEVERKIEDKRRFWIGLKIKDKNIHMQHAIKSGIEEYIHVLDGLVQKLTEDIKYLVKLDFEKDSHQNQVDVVKEIEEINIMEESYDRMMINLKNQFGVELSSE